jgi:hypothetical protein
MRCEGCRQAGGISGAKREGRRTEDGMEETEGHELGAIPKKKCLSSSSGPDIESESFCPPGAIVHSGWWVHLDEEGGDGGDTGEARDDVLGGARARGRRGGGRGSRLGGRAGARTGARGGTRGARSGARGTRGSRASGGRAAANVGSGRQFPGSVKGDAKGEEEMPLTPKWRHHQPSWRATTSRWERPTPSRKQPGRRTKSTSPPGR